MSKYDWRGRVLVIDGWPRGFCPVHYLSGQLCSFACVQVRVEAATAALALDRYFSQEYGRAVQHVRGAVAT